MQYQRVMAEEVVYTNRAKLFASRISGLVLIGGGLWLASLQKGK